jgi:hypothetical protein
VLAQQIHTALTASRRLDLERNSGIEMIGRALGGTVAA